MDYDDIGSDETAGTLVFDTEKLIEGANNGKFLWKNIYGSPMNQSNSRFKRAMNDNPEVASQWKGRILVQCIAEPTEKPLHKAVDIAPDIIAEA